MRELLGRKVFVYYNLHKHVWSVKCWETKRVIAHVENIVLANATYKVSQAGRKRVLKEKRKNVHAGVMGTILGFYNIDDLKSFNEVTYNPYKYDSFVYKGFTSFKAVGSNIVYMSKKRVFELDHEAILKAV